MTGNTCVKRWKVTLLICICWNVSQHQNLSPVKLERRVFEESRKVIHLVQSVSIALRYSFTSRTNWNTVYKVIYSGTKFLSYT